MPNDRDMILIGQDLSKTRLVYWEGLIGIKTSKCEWYIANEITSPLDLYWIYPRRRLLLSNNCAVASDSPLGLYIPILNTMRKVFIPMTYYSEAHVNLLTTHLR